MGGGGWWDLQAIAGNSGDFFSALVPDASGGAQNFTPTSPGVMPTISNAAIGGKRGLLLNSTVLNYLENDTLAAIFNGTNKPFTLVWDFQKYLKVTTQCMVGVGSTTTGSTRNFIEMTNVIAETTEIDQHTATNGTTSVVNATDIGYDETYYALTWDGTIALFYLNGVASALSPTTLDKAAIILNRFGWGAAQVGAVGFEGSNGFIRRLGCRSSAATPAEVAAIYSNMLSNNKTLPLTNTRVGFALFAGASVMNGTTDEINGMGARFWFANRVKNAGQSYGTQGSPQGTAQLRNTTATGGAGAPAIATQVAGAVTSRTRFVFVDLGDEEIDLNQDAPTVEAAIVSALSAIRTSAYAVNPQCVVVVNTIIPLFETLLNAVCIAVNAALPGIWNSSDAQFAGHPKLQRADWNTAIGGPSYVQANYAGTGNNHPNNLGYQLMGTAYDAAHDTDGVTLLQRIAGNSPT